MWLARHVFHFSVPRYRILTFRPGCFHCAKLSHRALKVICSVIKLHCGAAQEAPLDPAVEKSALGHIHTLEVLTDLVFFLILRPGVDYGDQTVN